MSIENLIKIGAAYGHHPLETLIEFEVIDPAWRTIPDIRAALKLAPEEWLADEVLNRMRLGAKTDEFTVPLDELVERKRCKTKPEVTPSPDDGWQYAEMAAADDSPDEPMPGDDDYHDGP